MLKKLLIIFGAIACGSAAPSCIDLCGPGSVNTQASESLTAFKTHSSIGEQHETLRDLHQSLTDQLQSSQINVDFDRPGNWTDHKDYRTPDGAGEVHEEAGQLVNGGAKVRYYKKKYAASYGSGSANNLGLGDALESDSLLRSDLLNSRSTVGHTDVHSYGHRGYDERLQDSSRFQDLETTGTQLHDSARVTGAASTDDWSRHDTYGVDGGRGRVYEEEGQYSQGPAKVRYYKKNYTSSYSTSGAPGIIPLTGVADLETQARQLESQLSQLSRDLQHTQVSQSQNIHKDSLHRDTTARQSEYGRVYNDNDYSQHYDRPVATTEQRYEHSSRKESTVRSGGSSYAPVQPVTSFNYPVPDTVGAQTHRTEHTQHTQQTHAYTPTQVVQTHQTHVPVQPVTHFSYVVPDTELEALGSQTQRTEHTQHIQQTHQTHIPIQPVTHFNYVVPDVELEAVGSQSQRTEHTQHTQQTHQTHGYVPSQVVQTHQIHQETDGITRVPLHRVNNYGGSTYRDESRRQELVSEGQTSHHQLRDDGQYVYSQPELSRVVQTQPGKRVEEHWSSSSRHRVESTIPHHIETVPIIDVGISHQKISQHNSGLHSGYADSLNQATNTRVSGGSSSSYHHEEFGTGGGSYHVGAVHVGHQAADCDTEGQQSSGYTRRYKRGVEFGQQTENLNRIQGQGQWGQVEGHQHQDYDHHSHPHQDDDRHRHSGQDYDHRNGGGYQHQSHEGHPHQDDDRHRHSGQDYDHRNGGGYQHQSHEGHPHQDDDRHRHSGQDYDHRNGGGYQHQSHEGHQHQDDDRYRHQQQEYLRYKREQSPQQYEDLNQHSEIGFGDLTHHKSGDFDFGQQQVENLELESQKTEDLHQQTQGFDLWDKQSGNLELGQQTEDLTQQAHHFDDFSQQSGNYEFGQHHLSGDLELGQQTEDFSQQTHKFDDFTQQQAGKLEFGQHHQQHTGSLEFGQQTEDLSQQTQKFDEFNQHTSDLEFGQHEQQHLGGLELGQQTEDLSQQTDKFGDFSQHQSGKLEFGQHHYQHLGGIDLGQQTEDLSQHTHKFDEFGQQSGDLEFGQHQQHTGSLEFGQQTEDFSQQTHKFDDFSQHSGDLEFGQHHQQHTGSLELGQQTEDLSQHTHKFDDFSQHTSDLEFGQQHLGGLELGQQTEDLSQQTHKFDDFTQQQAGKLEFGQHHEQHTGSLEFGQQTEDFSQQTHKFDDFTQQQAGKLEFGQHHNQHLGGINLGQQTEDLSQQTHKFDEFSQHSGDPDFGQQHLGGLELGQQTEDLSQQTHKFDDFSQHQSGSFEFGQQHTGKFEFGKETQETSQLGFDKQNQQTTGFSPSTNFPKEFKPAPKPTPRSQRIGNPSRGDIESVTVPGGPVGPIGPVTVPVKPVKGGRGFKPLGVSAQYRNDVPSEGVLSLEEQSFQSPDSGSLWHQSHHPGDLTSDHPQGQHSQIDGVTFQPRILEAYGGKGPYEAGHQEDIFSGIRPNPSATLAPKSHGNDPWEIREASEQFSSHRISSLDTVPESTTQSPETTPAPGFWKKLGNKITTSYEKAKEKLSDTFG
ncbi:filaggrin-2-like [Microplitis mediator]|uniref:filaggrin-2-like n=1 Tax=Microplitis mediator TaxID=375433 RepID=UPI002555C32B|nr:filaggrin-2-like [Microplitis mediator]